MRSCFALLLLVVSGFLLPAQTPDKALKNMKWRPIGPANMGGRVTDIEGIPGDPTTFYIAGADGGVFKTTNGGVTMQALFTDQKSYSVGDVTVAPSDPEVVYVGSGEGDPRNSVGYGHGVYRSTDGGKTWQALGLEKTDRIKRIVVHPQNPDVACVCALGREWGPNPDRGVFRTEDGGKTWSKVLYLDENTGCSDIAMEWDNPRIMYAGMWTFRRKPWRFDDSGEKTGLYKSTDGGKTWVKISHKNGLPDKPMARIGISIAQSQPNTVYVITEFKDGGTLFRSDDRGESWRLVNSDRNLNFRPFYYSDVRVDPNNPEVVYTLSGGLSKSTDGGRTFRGIARGQHGDNQALWIDPKNSNRVLNGDDGGYRVSYDGFQTYQTINNVELSQFYQLFVDDQDPYFVYGGLQDNGTWTGPSNSLHQIGILKRDWKAIAYGDGYYAVPIPGKENEVYANLQGGVIHHVDTKTGNTRIIHPYPNKMGSAGDAIENHKYRFNWDSPIHISPNDPNTVYTGGNVIFRSRDKGYNWELISPDLTTNDKSKQKSSGGEIYQDNTAAEFHCTILTIAESPVQKDVIWAGTDDGHVQLTRDGGKTWTNLSKNIVGLPPFAWISKIHASEHDAGTAFVAVDQHRMDDYRAYAFMTTDFGKTWTRISAGLPEDWVYVVRQDPHNANLLFAGMEHGIFASWDKGKTWSKINNNMPNVSVRDLRVQKRERDLVAATHGRGIWILDDIRALEDFSAVGSKEVVAFETRPATLWNYYSLIEEQGDQAYRAKNPDYGAYLNFYLAADPKEPVTVDIVDAAGTKVRSLKDTVARAGVNRIVWDLRHQEADRLNQPVRSGWGGGAQRPLVAPGNYTARLKANGQVVEMKIVVRGDPRIPMSDVDYRLKTETTLALRDQLSQTHRMINRTDDLLKQLGQLKDRVKNGGADAGVDATVAGQIDEAIKKLKEYEDEILRRPPPNMGYRQRPRLREEISSLLGDVDDATARPTQPQLERLGELKRENQEAAGQLDRLISDYVAPINDKVKNLPQVVVGKEQKKDM
ncbi:MAG: hypothetical protein JNL17_11525 [Cyclobacteriaceae bacterium]|nr:hypothetical protein [Cyclobacteriaceae bacterium]